MEDGEIRPLFLCHVKHKHWFPFIKLIGHSFWSDFYEWKSDPFPFIIIFHSFDIDTSHLVARWRNCLAKYTSLQSENLSKAQTQRGFHLCTLDVLANVRSSLFSNVYALSPHCCLFELAVALSRYAHPYFLLYAPLIRHCCSPILKF